MSEVLKGPGFCTSAGCEALAHYVVYWPGNVPAPVMCSKHTDGALRVAKEMGFELPCALLKSAIRPIP